MTRLNFTGRRRVTRERVSVRLEPTCEGPVVSVDRLHLDGLDLPPEAEVYVEVYRQTGCDRFACGTVGGLQLPRQQTLDSFDELDGLLVRVKVVGTGERAGLLLAAGRQIPPAAGEDAPAMSLLPVQPSGDLGQRLWKLDLEGEPTLLVNADLGDWREVTASPLFIATVFPEVVRQVALWLLEHIDDGSAPEGHVAGLWHGFLLALGGVPSVTAHEDSEEADEWADTVSAAFARRHRFVDHLRAEVETDH